MLVLFRRHQEDCPHFSKGRDYKKCDCPIWMDWRVDGRRVRRGMKTRSWTVAQQRARELEADGSVADTTPRALDFCITKFLGDCRSRNLRESSIYKCKLVLTHLQKWAEASGLVFLSNFDSEKIMDFR